MTSRLPATVVDGHMEFSIRTYGYHIVMNACLADDQIFTVELPRLRRGI
jgi:hypothetical protein